MFCPVRCLIVVLVHPIWLCDRLVCEEGLFTLFFFALLHMYCLSWFVCYPLRVIDWLCYLPFSKFIPQIMVLVSSLPSIPQREISTRKHNARIENITVHTISRKRSF